MTKPSEPLLDVRDLHVTFKIQKQLLEAVRGISFSVYPHEILGIVGESGCGKSAAAKALVKLLPPHSTLISGEVFFQGSNLLKYTESQMQKVRGKDIGMIFQDPITSLNPTMKIGDQIIEGYLLHHKSTKHSEAKDYALRLLELVGIPHASFRFGEYPHTLSGGMRQRVMIAIALAAKPKLIIADEPTTALDVTIQAQILDLMHKIKEKTGTSFILITHDMSVVAGYCDRVLVMYCGKIIEKASVEDIFSTPRHPYTQGLLQSIPRLDMPKDSPLIPIDGSPPNLTEKISGCAFCPRCKYSMPICEEQTPQLQELKKGHDVACWKTAPDQDPKSEEVLLTRQEDCKID
ncbi:MAG: Oligopeptide transport ATP-binding protein OppD [Chlamydiae bacterium]|nr:Oligopeptide transport ATP-binding protein OppD [Chlamydiota bacterium]